MTFLPIVARELRVACRRRSVYWIRFAAGALAAVLCAWSILLSHRTPHEAGVVSFAVLSVLTFVYAAIAGIQASSDCLSEEKREGTLGLLFLTDLRAHDVVLGKLAANSVNTIYGLLAVIPALGIPLLLGGVTSAEFGRVALVTLNLLFFFLTLGLFSSAICRSEQRALLLAIGIALFLVIAIPLFVAIRQSRAPSAAPSDWLLACPATACVAAFADAYAGGAKSFFWASTALTQLYGWILLLAACWITPRSWEERNRTARPFSERWLVPSLPGKLEVRRALLENNPYLWRCSRPERKRLLVWLTLAAWLCVWFGFAHMAHVDTFADPGISLFMVFIANALLKFWIAAEAATAFSEDRRSGAFELLLATPLPEKAFVRGQDLALWRQFGGPILVVLAAHFFLLWTATRVTNSPDDQRLFTAFFLIMAGSLALDSLALSRWSMWLGLSGRKTMRAALVSILCILVVPSVLFVVIITLLQALAPLGDISWFALFCWCVPAFVVDLYFTRKAQENLAGRFHECASDTAAARRAAVQKIA